MSSLSRATSLSSSMTASCSGIFSGETKNDGARRARPRRPRYVRICTGPIDALLPVLFAFRTPVDRGGRLAGRTGGSPPAVEAAEVEAAVPVWPPPALERGPEAAEVEAAVPVWPPPALEPGLEVAEATGWWLRVSPAPALGSARAGGGGGGGGAGFATAGLGPAAERRRGCRFHGAVGGGELAHADAQRCRSRSRAGPVAGASAPVPDAPGVAARCTAPGSATGTIGRPGSPPGGARAASRSEAAGRKRG